MNGLKYNAEEFVFKIENIKKNLQLQHKKHVLKLPSVKLYRPRLKQSILYQMIFNWNKLLQNLKGITSLHVLRGL